MARYIGAKCRLCRREGEKLYLKGDKCYSEKCCVSVRPYAPGQHGQNKKKISEYGLQLRAKQKAKRIYGVLEKQFRNYFGLADKAKGITGENLLRILECRLDNVIYRLGLANSRTEARQAVRHNHVLVNGKKVNIPSYQIKVGDSVEIKENSKALEKFKGIAQTMNLKSVPEWLQVNSEALQGKVLAMPSRDQIDTDVQETLIVELYSK